MANRTGTWRLTVIAAALTLGCCASCDWPGGRYTYNNGHGMMLAPYDTISAYQLASRLNMAVDRSDGQRAVLSDSMNTVMITADPMAKIYVNGRAIGHDGQILSVRGMLFVSSSAEASIGRMMTRRVAEPPPRQPIVRAGVRAVSASATQPRLGPVVIDAGHGGVDPGARGVNGVAEKTVNLAVALRIARLLRERNVHVIVTRADDTFVELDERCAISNRRGAALFVSIHSDFAPNNHQAQGCTAYIARAPSAESIHLAETISGSMVSAGISSRGVRNANFRVLVGTTAPSVLVELGFLSNHAEAAALVRGDYQRRLAEAIAAGVVSELHRMARAGGS